MTVTLRVLGTAPGNPTATTAINPTVGTGATSTDMSILAVAMKPYSTTITTPSGWTKIGEWSNGTVASGADVGSTKIALYYQKGAAVGGIGNITFSGADTAMAGIVTYQNATGSWDVANVVSASDTSDGTSYSATASSGLDIAAATDIVYTAIALNSDVGTISAPTFVGMTGATQQTQSGAFNAVNSQGNDCRLYARYVNFSAGSSTAAPGFTFTTTSATSGTQAFLRVREVAAANGTVTGALTFAGSASGARASAATVTGALTFAGTATGARAAQATSTGALAFVGSAAGARTAQGTTTGALTFTGAAAGKRVAGGTSSGAVAFVGSAVGSAPVATWSDSLLADWDADDLTGSNGSAVSSWTDKIGSFAANQGTGTAQPTLRTASINGHKAVEFDGTTDWMALPAGARALAQNVGSLAVFVVLTMPSSAVTGTRTAFSLSTGTSTASARVTVQARNASGFPAAAGRRLDADASVSQAASSAALSQPYVGVLTARYLWSSSDVYLYQDGTQVASNLSFQTSGLTENTVSLNGAIGARPEGTIERYTGTIARILVYPDATAGRRALIHTYLSQRYGITVSDYLSNGTGTVTGALTFAGTATGARTPKGTSTGTVTLVGTATGANAPGGAAAGAVSWSGTATGKRIPKAAVSGAFTFAGTAAGARASEGTSTGTLSWSGFVISGIVRSGTAAGAVTFIGAAAGYTARQGSVSGTVTYSGAGVGEFTAQGESSGEISWDTVAFGLAPVVPPSEGSTEGLVTWTGATAGTNIVVHPALGSAGGTITWTGEARGPRHRVGPLSISSPRSGGPWVGNPQSASTGILVGRPRTAQVTVGRPREESGA